jgi:hypothetical protein
MSNNFNFNFNFDFAVGIESRVSQQNYRSSRGNYSCT